MILSAEDELCLAPYMPQGLNLQENADAIARTRSVVMRMLLDQQLHPGQKVPMDTVAQELGISRTPVREALRLLEGEGLVCALPNRGFAIRSITVDETVHFFNARLCIERFTAEAAFDRRDDGFLRELCSIQEAYRRILKEAMNRRLGMVADKAFHVHVSIQADNPVLIEFHKKLFDVTFTRALDGFSLKRADAAIAEHDEIVTALHGSSRECVIETAAANVINGRDAVIAYLQAQESVRRTG